VLPIWVLTESTSKDKSIVRMSLCELNNTLNFESQIVNNAEKLIFRVSGGH
jgi:hypothetical protein